MKKIRLTENDIENLVKKIIKEDTNTINRLYNILVDKYGENTVEIKDNIIKIYKDNPSESWDGYSRGILIVDDGNFFRLGEFEEDVYSGDEMNPYSSLDFYENKDDWYWYDETYNSIGEVLGAIETQY